MKINISFDTEKEGILDYETIRRIFSQPSKIVGAYEGLFSIRHDPLNPSAKVFAVHYPKGIIQEDKTRIRIRFPKAMSITITYSIFFPKNFNFVRGGKLPGCGGEVSPVGGDKVDGTNGFSARIMWREEGKVSQYVYWLEKGQEKVWGDNMPWVDLDGDMQSLKFTRGQWHTLKTRISMNTPGEKNGAMESWFDGKRALVTKGAFRAKDGDFGIDQFIFITFFGGNDSSWAPKKNEIAYFKDISIETE